MSIPVPGPRARAASALSSGQRAALLAVADVLVPAAGDIPAASATPDYGLWLDRALEARSEIVADLAGILDSLSSDGLSSGGFDAGGLDAGGLGAHLRRLDAERPDDFRLLAQVIAGAYFMIPAVLDRIGYPGQHREPAGLTDAADELETGILDPVVDRGPMLRAVPGED